MINPILIQRSSNLFRQSLFTSNWSARKTLTGRLGKPSQRSVTSDSAAYDGDGKTTVTVLNQLDYNVNLINTYSRGGFRLHNNLFIYGSIILFPTQVYSWNVRRSVDITPESLLVFDLIVPKLKILIIGYGQQGEPYDPKIASHLRKRGISCEILPTPSAVTTYNYLVHDSVHVAGAFVPVRDDVELNPTVTDVPNYVDNFTSERDYFPEQSSKERVDMEELSQGLERIHREKGKKTFDE